MSPEAKVIVTKGVKILLWSIVPVFSTPVAMNYAFGRADSKMWMQIVCVLLTFACIGLLIYAVSTIVKGIFYDDENKINIK
ncbi:MAG: DUF6095 family protein [Flavobacteriales bacterium]